MDYKYLRAWCKMMGRVEPYTEQQLVQAREENAPDTAIFRQPDGKWEVYRHIWSDDVKAHIDSIVGEMSKCSA